MPMEHLERLVFRKTKERGTGASPCGAVAKCKEPRCAVAPWGDRSWTLDTDLKSAINEPMSSSTRHKQDVLADLEYLEYEKHVQARARVLKADGVGCWKALVFWKRVPRPAAVKSLLSHHHSFPTPLHRLAATPGRRSHGDARRACAPHGPLYTNESPSSRQQLSHRAWKDDCNMSPYVALSERKLRAVSPGPLYLV